MRDFDFNRHFDIDEMLREDAEWLAGKTELNKERFVSLARKFQLRQEDWNTFWRLVRGIKKETEGGLIEVYVTEKERFVSEGELKKLTQLFGEPEEVSNCCGVDIYPHNSKYHVSRCTGCGEGCGITYVF